MALAEYLRKRRLERRKRRRKRLGRSSSQPAGKWEEFWLRYGTTVYFVAGVVLLYFILRPGETAVGQLKIGDRAPEPIVAPFEFKYVDEERTEAERRKAEAEVRPVFSEIEGIRRERLLQYEALLDRAAMLEEDDTLDRNQRVKILQDEFPDINFFPTVWAGILDYYDDPALTEVVPEVVARNWNWIVKGDDDLRVIDDPLKGFDIISPTSQAVDHLTPGGVMTLAGAQKQVEDAVRNRTRGTVEPVAVQVARGLLEVNLVPNETLTQQRIRDARAEVKPSRW